MKPSSGTQLVYAFALLAISTLVFVLYIWLAMQNHFSQLEPMLHGTAPRPYVYRVLTPFLARVSSDILSVSPFTAVLCIMYLSLLGFSWFMWSFTKLLFTSTYAQRFALLAPVGLIPFLFEQRHIYDFPTLLLFTLSLWFLANGKFGAYLFTFFLTTLSKETSLFLILFSVLQFRHSNRRFFLSLVCGQLAIYLCIRFLLILLYQENPGGLVEFHFHEHLDAYLQNPAKTILLMVSILCFIYMAVLDRAEEMAFARNALLAIGGPTLLLYFFFGVPFEIRIFLEAYPAMFLVVLHVVLRMMDRHKDTYSMRTAN